MLRVFPEIGFFTSSQYTSYIFRSNLRHDETLKAKYMSQDTKVPGQQVGV